MISISYSAPALTTACGVDYHQRPHKDQIYSPYIEDNPLIQLYHCPWIKPNIVSNFFLRDGLKWKDFTLYVDENQIQRMNHINFTFDYYFNFWIVVSKHFYHWNKYYGYISTNMFFRNVKTYKQQLISRMFIASNNDFESVVNKTFFWSKTFDKLSVKVTTSLNEQEKVIVISINHLRQ